MIQLAANGWNEPILFSNLSMHVLCVFFALRLRSPLFSSNSLVHDGVGWVCAGKVETAIGQFRLLLQNRRRVSRPPSDIPDGSSVLGILDCLRLSLGRLEFGFVAHHCMHDDGEPPCQRDPGFSHRGPRTDCLGLIFQIEGCCASCQHHVRGLVKQRADPDIASL